MFGLLGPREVLDLEWVALRVVQFLVREAGREQGEGGAGQRTPRVQVAHQRQDQEAFLLVPVQRGEGPLGHEHQG